MAIIKTFVLNYFILLSIVCTKDIEVELQKRAVLTRDHSLCDDTQIHAADRLPNNTVRVYKDYFYWDLIGIPDRQVKVRGPFHIWFKNMKKVDVYSSIQTVISGQLKGVTFMYNRDRHWSWYPDGRLRSGRPEGEIWDKMPDRYFHAVYNDGDLDQKGFSQMIAFNDIHVYYYNTSGQVFHTIGDSNGYNGGKDGENFPQDPTAAFAFPGNSTNYLVYLFKDEKYCLRTRLIEGINKCPEWRLNSELFGCKKMSDTREVTQDLKPTSTQQTTEEKAPSFSKPSTQPNSILLILSLLKFYYKYL